MSALQAVERTLSFAKLIWSDNRHLALCLCAAVIAWTFITWVYKTFVSLPITRAPNSPLTFNGTTAELEKSVVNLHCFKCCPYTVSGSPYSTKVMLYARMTGLPHTTQVPLNGSTGPKGKVPFVEHNKQVIGDSQLIIRYLESIYDIAAMSKAVAAKRYPGVKPFVPYALLSLADQAVCDAVRIICESDLYWGGLSVRWLGSVGMSECNNNWAVTIKAYFSDMPALLQVILLPFIRIVMANQANAQGLARHSPEDQLSLCKRAATALSTFLGAKPYFLGDAPSECDAMAFGTCEAILDGRYVYLDKT